MDIKPATINIPDAVSGDWAVTSFEVSEKDADFHNMRESCHTHRYIKPGHYKKLSRGGHTVMSDTPSEVSDSIQFIYQAKGSLLISGLGLGVTLSYLVEKKGVDKITVLEKSDDVMKLVTPSFSQFKNTTIIHADTFTWSPPKGVRYDFAWHDIWDGICTNNLPEMTKLHKKYGRRVGKQFSWCKEICLLQKRREKREGWF